MEYMKQNPDSLCNIVDYIFIETMTKRKITIVVALRLLGKLIRLDQSQHFKGVVYKRLRENLIKLISFLRNIDLDVKNINSISMWIEDIFTKQYNYKKVLEENFNVVYDFRLNIEKAACHDLFIYETYDSNNKKIYNSIFLFSQVAFFFERNYKPQKKLFNFKKMYIHFYSSSIFCRFKENKTYNIQGKEFFAGKIKVKIQETIATIDV